MSLYEITLHVITHTGGMEKTAHINMSVEADSREEAFTRLRAAAGRIVAKPELLNGGESTIVKVDGVVTESSLMVSIPTNLSHTFSIWHQGYLNWPTTEEIENSNNG